MPRLRLLFLLLALVAVSGQHALPTCPVPSTSLMRKDDGRCTIDSRPPPMPVPPPPIVREDKLPSFEEWKQNHVEEPPAVRTSRSPESTARASTSSSTSPEAAGSADENEPRASSAPARVSPAARPLEGALPDEQASTSLVATSYIHPQPHAGLGIPEDPLLPLKSRTNYASNDCAAAVLQSSKASKHASSVLNSAKDRYMLTPCTADLKFVVVELCDEIDIDTVVLANWEFFSSMFKLFRASVSEVYPGRKEDWRELGTFRAGNLRGSQVFRPPHLGGFYRYIRIDFLTHYGSEYYCPVSLLQIYGRTQMEAYREEERAREDTLRRLKAMEEQDAALRPVDEVESPVEPLLPPLSHVDPFTTTSTEGMSENEAASNAEIDWVSVSIGSTPVPSSSSLNVPTTPTDNFILEPVVTFGPSVSSSETRVGDASGSSSRPYSSETAIATSSSAETNATSVSSRASRQRSPSSSSSEASSPLASPSVPLASSPSDSATSSTETMSFAPPASPVRSESARNGSASSSNVASRPRDETRAPPVNPPPPPLMPPGPPRESGESIYGTIMKRLSSLEYNSTLAMRYLDDQRRVVSGSIAKLERQMAASDTAVRVSPSTSAFRLSDDEQRQQDSQLIRRLILDFDLHRAKIEEERRALAAQVTVLANEIVFERRLGLVQLLALVIILGFVVLTRGSHTPLVQLPVPRTRQFAFPGRDEPSRRSAGQQSQPRRQHLSLGPTDRPAPSSLRVARVPSLRRRENVSAGASSTPIAYQPPRIRPIPMHAPGVNGRPRRSLTPPQFAPLLASLKIPPSPLSDRWLSTSGSEAESEGEADAEADVGGDFGNFTTTPREPAPPIMALPTPSPTPSPPATPTAREIAAGISST